jgi:hypothetical protein
MQDQLRGELDSAPGAAGQQGHAKAERQVRAFDEGGVEAAGEAGGLQALAERFTLAAEHDAFDFDQAVATRAEWVFKR